MAIEQTLNGKTVRYELKRVGGSVFLEATHIDGVRCHSANILSITPDGYLSRCEAVNKEVGLKLNSKGQIKKEKA